MANTVSRTISDETLSRIIQIESAGKPFARAATSSASGLGQFINGTWLRTVRRHGPAWGAGRSDAELLELRSSSPCSRFNARCSIEMLGRFTEDNAAALGPGYTDGDLYLSHFAGVGRARQVMRSEAVPAVEVFSPKEVAANRSILAGKTCGDVRAWAERKMRAASGRNWIAVHMQGAKPVMPPKEKAKAAAGAAGATGGGATTAQVAIEQGWGATEWLILIGCVALVAAAGIAAWRWWKKRNTPVKLEQPLGDAIPDPSS